MNSSLRAYHRRRERVVGAAEGRVLEIGSGSELNFPLYKPSVSEVIALERDPALLSMALARAKEAFWPIRFMRASAEKIPLDDKSMDTIITTWTLCTIPDGLRALQDMRRVLKPGGKLLFVEHGLAPDPNVQKWQNRLTPLWSRLSGGCHLNRSIVDMITSTGFRIEALDASYLPGPKIMGFFTEGSARPL